MDEACAEGTLDFLVGRGGLRARILNDGEIKPGAYELEILGDVVREEVASEKVK
jgi:hypothetical protein